MKRFQYRVLTPDGRQHEGYVASANLQEAKTHILNEQPANSFILELKPAQTLTDILTSKKKKDLDLNRKIYFTRQLQSLLSSGLTVLDALIIMQDMSRDKELKRILKGMIEYIGTGLSFSQACEKYRELYSEEDLALIRAGEASGVLDGILSDLYVLIEWDKNINEKIKKALRYPLVVIAITFGSMLGIFTFIIPKFAGFFASNGVPIPLLTRVLIAISQFIVHYSPFLIGGGSLLLVFIAWAYKKQNLREKLDYILFFIPLFGQLYKHLLITRFSRVFSILYTHGISVLEALQILRGLSSNTLYQKDINTGISNLRQGIPLSQSASSSLIFRGTPSQMIQTGEKGGNLGLLMKQASDLYSDDIIFVTDKLFTYLEPITIGIIGIMVLCLALGVFMPMLSMISTIGKG